MFFIAYINPEIDLESTGVESSRYILIGDMATARKGKLEKEWKVGATSWIGQDEILLS